MKVSKELCLEINMLFDDISYYEKYLEIVGIGLYSIIKYYINLNTKYHDAYKTAILCDRGFLEGGCDVTNLLDSTSEKLCHACDMMLSLIESDYGIPTPITKLLIKAFELFDVIDQRECFTDAFVTDTFGHKLFDPNNIKSRINVDKEVMDICYQIRSELDFYRISRPDIMENLKSKINDSNTIAMHDIEQCANLIYQMGVVDSGRK